MQQTHRRGDTCVARNTVAPQSTRTPHLIAQPTRIRRRTTRLVNCAVPAPGVINGAPTSYAVKQPTRNNVQPPQCNRRTVGATLVSPGTPPPPIHTHAPPHRATHPHPPTHNATGQLCCSSTGRHEWRPYELRRKTTDAKQRSAATMQQTHRRGDTCVARNTVAPNPHAHRPQRATRPHAFPCRNPNGCHECTPTATEKTTPLPVKTGTAPARTGRASTRKCGAIEKLFAY